MAEPRASRKQSTGWRLVPRVQDIGFFQGLLVSRTRLVIGALGATATALLVVVLVSGWMRTTSGSPMLNVLIIALMLTGLIIAAYIDALLIGDLFFPGRWREQTLQGENFQPEGWSEEQASVKEYNTPFLLIVIAMVVGLTWLSQALTGGFLFYYQNLGFALTLMRSDDPDDRYMGLDSISNPLYEAQWEEPELHEHLVQLVDDPDPRVQSMALYVAGRLQVVRAGDPMLEVFRDAGEEPEARASAAMALGRLKWEKSLAWLANGLRSPSASTQERLGIVRGLALMEASRTGEPLVRLLESCGAGDSRLSEELVINAFYALRQSGYGAGGDVSLSYLRGEACGGEVSLQEQCAAADALRFAAEERHIEPMQRVYPTLPIDYECGFEMWQYRDEKGIEIVEKEPLRAKLVRAVGNLQDYDSYEWIWNIGDDTREDMKTRKVAELYARQILQRYEQDKSVRRKR